jgi:hypothetical protein
MVQVRSVTALATLHGKKEGRNKERYKWKKGQTIDRKKEN